MPMTRPLAAAALALGLCLTALPAHANPQVLAAQTCLADSTSGKDRKVLGRWIFSALAAHPEITALSKVGTAERDQISREFAALFTRLVSQDCATQFRELAASQGTNAMGQAFEHLGKVAMQELMGDPAVNSAISVFEKYVDEAALERAIGTPGKGGQGVKP